MLGDNARIDNVRKRIITELNAAHLPIYVAEFIVGEIYTELQKQRVAQVKREQEDYIKEAEEQRMREKAATAAENKAGSDTA